MVEGALAVAVVIGILVLRRILVIVARILLSALHLAVRRAATAEEFEVVYLIAHTDDPVLAGGLVELHTRHTEAELAGGLVLQLAGEVVVQGHIHTEQRGEVLRKAHRRYIEHAVGHRIAGRGVGDESQAAGRLHPSAVAGIGAHRIEALVRMVQIHALEERAEPGQAAQSAVADGPVGQQAAQCGEDVKTAAAHAGIAGQEGRHEHIGAVGPHPTVFGIEGLSGQCRSLRVDRIGVPRLYPLAEGGQ